MKGRLLGGGCDRVSGCFLLLSWKKLNIDDWLSFLEEGLLSLIYLSTMEIGLLALIIISIIVIIFFNLEHIIKLYFKMLRNKATIMFMLVIIGLLLTGVKNDDDEYIEEEKPRKVDEVIKNEYENEQILEAELASNTEPEQEEIINEEIPTITEEEQATVVEQQEESQEENKAITPEENDNKDINVNDNRNTETNNSDNNSNNKELNDEHEVLFNNEQPHQQPDESIYQYKEAQNDVHLTRPFHVQNEMLNMVITRMELFVVKIHSQINVYIKHPYDLLFFFLFGYTIASLFCQKSSRITIQKHKQETDTNIFTLDKVSINSYKLILLALL